MQITFAVGRIIRLSRAVTACEVRATGVVAGLLATLSGSVASAQMVRGVIVDRDDRVLIGAVTLLLDSASRTVAQDLTNKSGEFHLRAPSDGVYRIRALRIGFRPTVTHPFNLRSDQDISQRISLDALVLMLDTVRIGGKGACRRVDADSSGLVFTVWEQARTAMTAAQLTNTRRTIRATTIDYQRVLEPNGGRIRSERSSIATQFVRQPWRSLTADSLRHIGYVVSEPGDSRIYYAPGLDVLLSAEFVADHCFRLARSSNARQIGLEFEPSPDRRRIPEITGTLWLTRGNVELQSLEFRYANVTQETREHAGGEMRFGQLGDGGWVISEWSIRMPQLERPAATRSFRGQRLPDEGLYVAEVHVTGGTVSTLLSGRDTVWSHPPITFAGVVLDSLSAKGIANSRVVLAGTRREGTSDNRGRFSIAGVPPGAYTVKVRTPSLDSINTAYEFNVVIFDSAAAFEIRAPLAQQVAARLCGQSFSEGHGIISGRLTIANGDSIPGDANLFARWFVRRGNAQFGEQLPVEERRTPGTRVAEDGTFRLCVPTNTSIDLVAGSKESESAELTGLRISPDVRYVQADLQLVRIKADHALFTGNVRVDSTQQPIANAEVSLVDLERITTTNAIGAFRLADVPPGKHRVQVRRLGYGPLEMDLLFAAGERVERRIYLQRVTALDSVLVIAPTVGRGMESFEAHRQLGLGHFLTRSDLSKAEGRSVEATLYQLPGIRFAYGHPRKLWAIGGRGARGVDSRILARGDIEDREAGSQPNCYALVYVDKARVYSGRRDEHLFDLSSIRPDQLEAVEYYAGGAQTPSEYTDLGSSCGVLVLWTRKSS